MTPTGISFTLLLGTRLHPTGYQLSDQILLRVDSQTQKATGVTIFNYSHHTSASGDIPMPGLDEHPDIKPYF
jgi:hypothetical protein